MAVERLKHYINGEWVESKSTEIAELRNPAYDTVIGEAPMATPDEVQAAVAAATDAFPEWRIYAGGGSQPVPAAYSPDAGRELR